MQAGPDRISPRGVAYCTTVFALPRVFRHPLETRIIRGVLFDLDDTLNDRSRSWSVFLESFTSPGDAFLLPCSLPDVHRMILNADHGGYRPKVEFFDELRAKLPWRLTPTRAEIEKLWRDRFPRCTVLRDGALALLQELRARNMKLGIVTNGRVETQIAKIAAMGVEPLVQTVVISEQVGTRKPEPGIFHCALKKLGLAPAECFFVGDDPERDVAGAARAGMRSIWLANDRVWPDRYPPPDHVIDSLWVCIKLLELENGNAP